MDKIESALMRTTDTRAVIFGVGTLPRVAELFTQLFPGNRAVVVADPNTWRVAGEEVHRLLEEAGVSSAPGEVFGMPGHFRITYCRSYEEIEEGLRRIKKAVESM